MRGVGSNREMNLSGSIEELSGKSKTEGWIQIGIFGLYSQGNGGGKSDQSLCLHNKKYSGAGETGA